MLRDGGVGSGSAAGADGISGNGGEGSSAPGAGYGAIGGDGRGISFMISRNEGAARD